MKKELLKILPLFLLTVVLGLAVAFMPVRKQVGKKAAWAGEVGVNLSPVALVLGVGGEEDITIIISNPQKKKISFADIRFSFDKNILEMKSFAINMSVFSGGETDKLGNDTGSGQIVVYNTTQNLTDSEMITVGVLKIKAKSAGASNLAIIKDQSQVVIENPGSDDLEVMVASSQDGRYVVGGEISPGKVVVKLDPPTAGKGVNQEFDVELKVESGSFKIGFMQLVLNFDSDKLQIVKFTPNPGVFSADGFSDEDQILAAAGGVAKLFALNLGDNLAAGNFTAGKIKLKGTAAGTASLDIGVNQDSYFAGLEATEPKMFYIEAGQNGSYTFTTSRTVPVLNFKIKFQGIDTKRADQKVAVIVKKAAGITKTYTDIPVSADSSGVYLGSVVLADFTAGDKVNVFIKGPKHLAKKFCQNNQTGRCGEDSAGIALSAGENNLDFSKLVLEAGDLPNPNEDNQQDGVVNSVDFSLIESRVGKVDSASLSVADLNLDGIVNWGDAGLLLNTLGTKYEDEY
ncbi:hypothetical protein CO010_00765 [Candidatus Shapirobacteria bacterium CG_4_8_14_3_um_filter_39_11]|uniref:Dockerin domain-containing protein n=1 Tax=Candidatus Shapirobacteria bacterium CG_4_8_14_3_um_filter_39_11 TaxID=1974875 RepID=A0A2M8GI22_9BACT|nr:MAG: hypothetical protein CO010_00765 [Candidatus Shapirobacteria bacterium CG_4_8_14_3_um_filter_39_11]